MDTQINCDNSCNKFETFWEQLGCGIIIIDAETFEVVDVNPAAVRMYGAQKEQMLGNVCRSFFQPSQKGECVLFNQNQSTNNFENNFVRANGKSIPIVKTATKIDYNGRPSYVEAFIDATKSKQADERVMAANLTRQVNEAKIEFLARMSHEMRTPMNAILGMAKIAESTDSIEKLRYCLSVIESSSLHLLSIINDVLDMSSIEFGKFELYAEPFDIESMLIKVADLISEIAEQKQIEFNVLLDPSMDTNYIGDELRLSQVITNLASNAVKFTPKGGRIKIDVCETCAEEDYSILKFSVQDSGIGMTSAQIKKLFTAFEQVDNSMSRRYGGTGLGLAISKSIVEKMDGRIWVDSTLNVGSTFGFQVKLKRMRVKGNPLETEALKYERVLFVSNSTEARFYFKSLASRYSIYVDEAMTGKVALKHIESADKRGKPYNAIFIDSNLSDISYKYVLDTIKNKDTAIIMASAKEYEEMCQPNINTAEHYITRPIFPSKVFDVMRLIKSHRKVDSDVVVIVNEKKSIPDFSNINILLAEDIAINREVFLSLLEPTNINIDSAENGEEAVSKFINNADKYDMILMDMQMPYMDGCEATRAIRALDFAKAKSIPIIALTANVFKEDIERCLIAGMDDHMPKPIDEVVVIEKIKKFSYK